MLLKHIKEEESYEGIVQIVKVSKPGPYIFTITDGDSCMEIVFGEQRVAGEYKVHDLVNVRGKGVFRYERMQLEGEHISAAQGSLEGLEESTRTQFSVNSGVFGQMRPLLQRCAVRIKQAIMARQPIILRFHGDADGIVSSLALQHAMRAAGRSMGTDPLIYTSVSPSPVYDTQSMLRDVSNIEGHKQTPLFIFADMGSSADNEFPIRALRLSSSDVLVLDHHPAADVISQVSLHCNPQCYDAGSDITAGMLCYELARMIREGAVDPLLPAVAALGDKSQGDEAHQYMGAYDEGRLKDYVRALDFVAFHLRYDSGDRLYPLLLRDKAFFDIISQQARFQMDQALQEASAHVGRESHGSAILVYADLEKVHPYIYPSKGRLVGALFEQAREESQQEIVAIGLLRQMCILRLTQPWLHELGEYLQQQFPSVKVDTRGHAKAGTLRVGDVEQQELLRAIRDYLS